MKLGIIGLARAGKATVFEALTQRSADGGSSGGLRIGTIRVPDERIAMLHDMYRPKKTINAQVEYALPRASGHIRKDADYIFQIRDCDALVHVVRNFSGYGFEAPTPAEDFRQLEQELILADLMVVEKRRERLELDLKRGVSVDQTEVLLLKQCCRHLEAEQPLRKYPESAEAPLLRGFAFVSGKPMLVLFNNEDEDEELPCAENITEQEECMVIRAKLEQELAQMTADEAREFLTEFNIAASAMDRVIQKSYTILGLISFFTVLNQEVRAWTVKNGTEALDAAGTVHTDMQKGFIRAEVVAYDDLMAAGSYQEAKKRGMVRLEGKTYPVQDGDIIQFRFNV